MKNVFAVFALAALTGACAEQAKIKDPAAVEFITISQDSRFTVNGMTVAAAKGQKFELYRLADGRKVVLLNSWVNNEPFLMGMPMPQRNGALLDENWCTTANWVNIGKDSVNIEPITRNTAGVCFNPV